MSDHRSDRMIAPRRSCFIAPRRSCLHGTKLADYFSIRNLCLSKIFPPLVGAWSARGCTLIAPNTATSTIARANPPMNFEVSKES